jgi:hypothetical protein
MDSLTLSILVFTFFAAMILYFATHTSHKPKGQLREAYKSPLRNVKRQSVPDVPLFRVEMPEILRYNLAVQNMLQRGAT